MREGIVGEKRLLRLRQGWIRLWLWRMKGLCRHRWRRVLLLLTSTLLSRLVLLLCRLARTVSVSATAVVEEWKMDSSETTRGIARKRSSYENVSSH